MTKEIKVALFGVGGFAANYVNALAQPERENVRLVGAVDPFASGFTACRLYGDAEEMLRTEKPDIAVIATPIQFHAEQAELAFRYGCNVVMEKPVSATVAGARRVLKARDSAGKLLNIDYQLCYDKVVRAVRADANSGVFGAPVSLKVIVLWPRDQVYYHRGGGWAGKKIDAQGREIYDSVLNNATAHYLMNMLFMTGEAAVDVKARTYRANPIETYDTAIMKARSAGADIFIAVSHAAGRDYKQEPMFEYRYEKATLRFGAKGEKGSHFTAHFADGRVEDYGEVKQPYMANLWNMVDAIREGREICCGAETALLQTRAVESIRLLEPDATPFPEKWIRREEDINWVPGLAESLWECFEKASLPDWDLDADALKP